MCLFALSMISCIRNPAIKAGFSRKQPVRRRVSPELERGRSRISKDLRGGAIAYYPRHSYSTVDDIRESVKTTEYIC